MTNIEKYLQQKIVLEQTVNRMDTLAAEYAALIQRQGEIEHELEQLSQQASHDFAFSRSQAPSSSPFRQTKSEYQTKTDESVESGAVKRTGASRSDLVARMSGERRSVSAAVREFEETANRILLTASTPLTRNAMYSKILDVGLSLPGDSEKDRINALGARMSRMPGVENVRTSALRGYWLKDRMHEIEKKSENWHPKQVGLDDSIIDVFE